MKTNSETQVRVRFAPSPTGYPHLGNIRTALFNWLFARHHGGKFILRIEDTDTSRKVDGAVETILDSLRWLGITWDEGPFFQSQRLSQYQEIADKLLKEDNAYLCYCSPERLETMRHEQSAQKQPPKYDQRCRHLSQEEKTRLENSGIAPVVRFKMPLEGEILCHDMIRGEVTFKIGLLDDFVILKSDGYPTYHLASIIDDHSMNISHVLRADEWLSSTPKHLLLYQALGWQPPQFAHLPMILGPDRSKLSKRHGAAALTDYREQGFLPEAMLNFLALLGWSLDDKTEILSLEELVKHFSLQRVGKSAAIFNRDKLEWMNGIYLRQIDLEDFTKRALPFLDERLPAEVKRPLDNDYVKQVMLLVQERVKSLADIPELTSFFFLDNIEYDTSMLLIKGMEPQIAARALQVALEKLEPLPAWDIDSLENTLRPLTADLDLSASKLFGLLRVATTGRTAAPPLFQSMATLGKEKCLQRIKKALQKLNRPL